MITHDDATHMTGTLDRAGVVGEHATFYITEQIGDKRSLTPEGFLLCLDVPLARTGEMIYGPGETPLKVGDQGYLIIERTEDEVFRPEFVSSFEGKPVVNDHPTDRMGVTPDNWRKLAVGHVINPRRGEGPWSNFIVADLLITDQEAIDDIESGKREVSAGYAAEYVPIRPGRGMQKDMVANHVALVRSGRCGSRCSIRDDLKAITGDKQVNKSIRARLVEGLRGFFKDGTSDETVNRVLDESLGSPEAGHEDVHIHMPAGSRDDEAHTRIDELNGKVDAHDARHAAHDEMFEKLKAHTGYKDAAEGEGEGGDPEIEGELEEEAPEATGDKARKATDSRYLADAYQEAAAGAEILVPGINVGTFDKKADPKKTLDQVKKLRSHAIDLAFATPHGRPIIQGLLGGADKKLELDKMKTKDVRSMFRQAVTTRKEIITDQSRRAASSQHQQVDRVKGVTSARDLNAMYKKHYQPRP